MVALSQVTILSIGVVSGMIDPLAGKVEHGKVTVGDKVKVISRDGVQAPQTADMKVTKLFYLQGLQRVEVNEAYAGTNTVHVHVHVHVYHVMSHHWLGFCLL